MHTPRELIQAAKDGDRQAFGELYKRYLTPVFRYIYARVGNQATAEDLTQTVFVKVFEAITRFQDQGKEPLAYFFTTARHLVIDHWKKRKDVLLDDPATLERLGGATPPEPYQDGRLLTRLLALLTAEQREVVAHRLIADRSTRETADLMGKSEEAIRQLLCRALRVLRAAHQSHPDLWT